MKKKVNFLLKRLLREFEEERGGDDFLSALLYKNLMNKLRNEIEEMLFLIVKTNVYHFIVQKEIKIKDEALFIRDIKKEEEPFIFKIENTPNILRFRLIFSIENVVNKILEKFECKVKNIEEIVREIGGKFFSEDGQIEETVNYRDCYNSLFCVYILPVIEGRWFEHGAIEWKIGMYRKKPHIRFLSFEIEKYFDPEGYYSVDLNILRNITKRLLDELYKKDDFELMKIFNEFDKKYGYLNLISVSGLDKEGFVVYFSNFVFSDVIEPENFYKEIINKNLVKVIEERKEFIKKIIASIKKFKKDVVSGKIINFILRNKNKKEMLIKIVSDYCKNNEKED